MTSLPARVGEIQGALDVLAARHKVPGAVVAVGHRGVIVDAATGVLNVDTGQRTTTDSVFQIGSNTKILTTTLVMQLVDEGLVDLDEPVVTYVPGFRLKVAGADRVTVRHLLTHTSGLPGDHFVDYGRGDEATKAYVESLATFGFDHPTGALFSYCNAGFTLAGHLAEVLTGTPYRTLLRERIAKPLGLRRMTTALDDMFALPTAVGHVTVGGGAVVHPTPIFGWSSTPAGSMTVATAAELVTFTNVLLADGVAPDGTRVLSAGSARAMRTVEVERPRASTAVTAGQGLGWRVDTWGDAVAVGHGGATMGQLSFLQALPAHDLTIALLTNSGTGSFALWDELGGWLFEALADVRMATNPPPADPPPTIDPSRYVGTYARTSVSYEVTADDDGLLVTPRSELQMTGSAEVPVALRLRPVDESRFLVSMGGRVATLVFLEFVRGKATYLHDGRAARRTPPKRRRSS